MEKDIVKNLFSTNDGNIFDDLTGSQMDYLKSIINSHHQGVSTFFLEKSNKLTFPKNYLNNDNVHNKINDDDLIWLCDGNPPGKDNIHQSNGSYWGSWSDPNYQTINVSNEAHERASLFLDRYPDKKHAFVGLVQYDSNWEDQAHRDKLIEYGFLGASLYPNKYRSTNSHPNGGFQFFGGWHRNMQDYVRQYATRSVSKTNIVRYSKYKVRLFHIHI